MRLAVGGVGKEGVADLASPAGICQPARLEEAYRRCESIMESSAV